MTLVRLATLRNVLAFLLFGIATTASAEVVLSNLQPPPGVGSGIGIGLLNPPDTANTIVGQDFVTGSTAPGYRLNSVTLHMADAVGNPGNFVLELYTGDLSGVATGPLGEFTVTSNPFTAGHHTFDFADDLILAPGTRYMIVASAPNAAGSTASRYSWHLGNFLGVPGDAWGVGGRWTSSNGGASWAPVRSTPFQFAIDATAIPEPAALSLAAMALVLTGRNMRRRSACANRLP